MNKIRYGVIGVNGVGKYHIKLISKNSNAQLTAIADSDEGSVKKKAQELEIKGFTDHKDLINSNLVDAVSICTPHNLHASMSVDFLNAGIHVLVEKPLSITLKDADKILIKAKEKNLKVCVGHQYRTHRSSQVIKNIIESGKIGRIMRVMWSWNSFRSDKYYEYKPWHKTWKESGGGVLMNQVSHDLDLICWLIGKPLEVSSIMGNQLHEAEIEDIVCTNILFENGTFGSFQFTINQPSIFSVRQIFGEKGAIIINDVKSLTEDMDDEIKLCIYKDNVSNLVEKTWDHFVKIETYKLENLKAKKKHKSLKNTIKSKFKSKIKNLLQPSKKADWLNWQRPIGRKALIDDFIDSVINNRKPAIDAESAHTTVELINAIILSAMRKKTVKLPINRDEYDELFNELVEGKSVVPRFRN